MNKILLAASSVVITLTIGLICLRDFDVSATAPNKKALAGAWERIFLTDAQGQPTANPAASILVFSPEGYYAQTSIPNGRTKIDKPLKEMTKEELINRIEGAAARSGTFSVTGNTLTRKTLHDLDPSLEGGDLVQTFKLEGDTLTLLGTTNKIQARFRRLK